MSLSALCTQGSQGRSHLRAHPAPGRAPGTRHSAPSTQHPAPSTQHPAPGPCLSLRTLRVYAQHRGLANISVAWPLRQISCDVARLVSGTPLALEPSVRRTHRRWAFRTDSALKARAKSAGEEPMTRSIGIYISMMAVLAAAPVAAQETSAGPGTLEVTVIPGGATFLWRRRHQRSAMNSTRASA
jgi:hypothetical protein